MTRTKSVLAHSKVLEAALDLFAERGIEASSMDAIAECSGVSKATIYKHWADKEALALEALSLMFGFYEEPPKFDSGDLRQDFVDALTYQPATEWLEMKNRVMPHVISYAARNQQFGEQWRKRAIELPRRRLADLLQRGIRQKNLRGGIDVNTALALLLGPMLYWHIFTGIKGSAPPPRELAVEVVRAFWKAYGKES